MIDRTHVLGFPAKRRVLNISRGAVYYQPRPVSPKTCASCSGSTNCVGARSRALACCVFWTARHCGWPSACWDPDEAHGIEAVYRRRDTSKPAPGHKIYPYLLPRGPRDGRVANSLGDGHHLYPDGARASSISSLSSTGSLGACFRIGCRSRWRPASASRLSRGHRQTWQA